MESNDWIPIETIGFFLRYLLAMVVLVGSVAASFVFIRSDKRISYRKSTFQFEDSPELPKSRSISQAWIIRVPECFE